MVTVSHGLDRRRHRQPLQQRGLVRSALVFRLAAEQAGVGSSLAAGNYELSRSMSTNEIIQVLAKGQVKRGLVATIPEGWRSEQIADRLEATGFASRDEFLRAVSAPQSVPVFRVLGTPAPQRLEGYLFPETYEVPQKVAGTRAADLMVQMFSKRIGGALRTSPTDSKLTPLQVLTLASIVEREAKQPSERATIASVYLNRLAEDMPLQADPTVQYAVATRDGARAATLQLLARPDASRPGDRLALQHVRAQGLAARSDLQSGRGVHQSRAFARKDRLPVLRRHHRRQRHAPFAKTLGEHNANVAKVSQSR